MTDLKITIVSVTILSVILLLNGLSFLGFCWLMVFPLMGALHLLLGDDK